MNRVERALKQAHAESPAAGRAARLKRFTAKRDDDDRQTVDHWRERSPVERAAATCALSDYAHRMVRQTGFRTVPESLPRFSQLLTVGSEGGQDGIR